MPTYDEMEELIEKCSWEWIEQNGVSGYKVIGPNGYSIFLPAAGCRYESSLNHAGSIGFYWSSSPSEINDDYAFNLSFFSVNPYMDDYSREYGQSVRSVLE